MEFDKLKQNWDLLDKRLEQCEVLNKRIIQEMITKRTNTAYNLLFNLEIINLFLAIINIPVFLIISYSIKVNPPLPWIIGIETALVLIIIWEIFKIRWLKKFDIETTCIFKLSKIISTYRNWLVKECYVAVLLVIVAVAIRYIEIYVQNNLRITILFTSIAIFVPVYIVLYYRFFIKKYSKSIQQSLTELKEFKE